MREGAALEECEERGLSRARGADQEDGGERGIRRCAADGVVEDDWDQDNDGDADDEDGRGGCEYDLEGGFKAVHLWKFVRLLFSVSEASAVQSVELNRQPGKGFFKYSRCPDFMV